VSNDAGRIPIVVAVIAVLLTAGLRPAAAEPPTQDRMRWAATQLAQTQLPSGLLAYDFDFVLGAPTAEDNIVRQAGVLAYLAEYYALTHDARVRPAVERGLVALTRLSRPLGRGSAQSLIEASGILSVPVGRRTMHRTFDGLGLLYRSSGEAWVVTSGNGYGTAFTGATAMAVIAELHYSLASGSTRFRPSRMAWIKGLQALRLPSGGFRTSPEEIETSPFADGQAWLALAVYRHLHSRDETIRPGLETLEAHLMRAYGRGLAVEFYQWGTMAAAVRFDTTSDRRFLDFVAQQTDAYLETEPTEETRPLNSCAGVEGLATAAGILAGRPGYESLVPRIEQTIRREMDMNRKLQIPPRARAVKLSSDVWFTSGALGRFEGAFLEGGRHLYTRIDHTGHCLSALMKLHRHGLERGTHRFDATAVHGEERPKRETAGR
jgi:hypothetical protein